MQSTRPVNHNPFKYKFPITALVSIGHRISGIVLFIAIPFALSALSDIKASQESFAALSTTISGFAGVIVLAFLGALFYHLMAGIRHLIMDFGYGETMRIAKITAWILIVLELVLLITVGVLIWA